MSRLMVSLVLLMIGNSINAGNPEELGKVEWYRDLAEAREVAASSKKPILILFQEIPGCLTCRTYGKTVLSHPLIVETIETYFVPLAIYNNRRGKDADVLDYYGEPSWNNPVVRIVGSDTKDVVPRLSGNYTPSGLTGYLINGMQQAGSPVPDYLPLLHAELAAVERGVEKTTLSMFCFWTGEKELGSIDGVVRTEAGYMDSREVVNVYFDPAQVSLETIFEKGQAAECADRVYASTESQKRTAGQSLGENKVRQAGNFRLDREPKYYLRHTDFRRVPMTQAQAVKINALIGEGKSPLHLLSPRQQMMYYHLQKNRLPVWASEVNDPDWDSKMFDAWRELGYRT